MASNNVPTSGKLVSAAGGNSNLLEVLRQITANMQLQQQVTSTSGKNVPAQASGAVSYLQGNYIVQITNPGAVPPLSALQAAQQTQGQTSQATTAPITPIYHQIQAAGSPRFDIAANVQTFGGDTGSAQTFWTLTNLGSGNFYFRFRSSYDGVNFNQWKNANGGQSITSRPDSVTVETVTNGVFGVFQLAGSQLVAVGAGLSSDGGTFSLPDYLYSSAMQAIAAPNGFIDKGHTVSTISQCDVAIAVPSQQQALTGPADYPIVVNMEYEDNGGNINPGIANWFSFAFDPLGSNVTLVEYSSGNWAVFQMPGGWQMAIGSGTVASGSAFTLPPGFNSSNMLAIPTPNGYVASGHQAAGIANGSITGNVLTMEYCDNSSNTWTSPGNWFAVAWSPGVASVTTSGGKWLVFTAPSGSQIAFGAGTVANGASFGLPTGFNSADMLAIATPATVTLSGNVMHGINACDIVGTTARLSYQDGSGNVWSGNCNWFAFAWL